MKYTSTMIEPPASGKRASCFDTLMKRRLLAGCVPPCRTPPALYSFKRLDVETARYRTFVKKPAPQLKTCWCRGFDLHESQTFTETFWWTSHFMSVSLVLIVPSGFSRLLQYCAKSKIKIKTMYFTNERIVLVPSSCKDSTSTTFYFCPPICWCLSKHSTKWICWFRISMKVCLWISS